MPMSASAYEGLRAAVAYNPRRAREFVDIVRSFPAMVKRKPDDEYGPLILMLRTQPGSPLVASSPTLLTEQQRSACRRFNEEWLRRDFTKRELADAIESILEQIGT